MVPPSAAITADNNEAVKPYTYFPKLSFPPTPRICSISTTRSCRYLMQFCIKLMLFLWSLSAGSAPGPAPRPRVSGPWRPSTVVNLVAIGMLAALF